MPHVFGRSLHIGVNEIDPDHYANYRDTLEGCENDAWFMAGLARHHGFADIRVLLGRQATADTVLNEIRAAAIDLSEGGYFLLTFAGHGGQIPNIDTVERGETYDQTWCLYDRELIDDELRLSCWPMFRKDTRVLIIIDSCHSGSSIEVPPGLLASSDECSVFSLGRQVEGGSRSLPKEVAAGTARKNRDLYADIKRSLAGKLVTLAGSVMSIAACQDDEQTPDGPQGRFTETLRGVWDEGRFVGSHGRFYEALSNAVVNAYGRHPMPCCDDTIKPEFLEAAAFKI